MSTLPEYPKGREDHYRELEYFIREGKSEGWICRHYDISRASARRQIARVKAVMNTNPSALAILDDDPMPPVTFRQFPIIAQGATLKGGRQTRSSADDISLNAILPPPDNGEWRLEDIDPDDLRLLTPAQLLPRLIRVSPEVSRGYYDFLRMANPGWDLKAYYPGTDRPHKLGQEYLNFCINVLSRKHGSVDVVWNKLLSNGWIRGAIFFEMVLESDARTFSDIAIPDAYSARFKVVSDGNGGRRYQLVQGVGKNQKVLDSETVRYIPVDPLPDTPYGTSIAAPGLFPALFLITMLQDARRVVAQQGWPRMDIIIDVAKIINTMPENDQDNPEKVKAWVRKAVEEVSQSYSRLEPDQAWVHADTVTLGKPVGAIGNLEGVDALVAVLERMAVRSLKSMPLLFGMPEGVSEANANRQWEVHVQGIQAIQGLGEESLSYEFTLAMEAQGIPAEARFNFHELRAAEELRDGQVFFQKLENAQRAELLGYWEHDEASNYAVGHPAANTPIGVVGDEEDQPEDEEAGDVESGAVMEGDTADEKPPKTDDGATLSATQGYTREDIAILETVFSNPLTAHGAAMAMHILSGRATPKLDPKGKPVNSGKERVTIYKTDVTAARRDFDGRIDDEYVGLLSAQEVTGEN